MKRSLLSVASVAATLCFNHPSQVNAEGRKLRRREGSREVGRDSWQNEFVAPRANMLDTVDASDEQKFHMMLSTRALNEVNQYVDWDKLRDEYLLAVYEASTRDESTRRQLAENPRRQRRHSGKRKRRKTFNLNIVDDGMDETISGEPEFHTDEPSESSEAGASGRSFDTSAWIDASDGALVFVIDPDEDYGATDNGRQQGIDDDVVNNEGIDIPIYNYNTGNCPGPGDSPQAVPCAPDNLEAICSKYSGGEGKFSTCFNACRPAFCCIHDAPPATNFIAPNCNTDVNCAQYAYCYIVWWKLHDTIGPATELRLEQTDDFYDVDSNFVQGDVTNIQFFREMLFHHFNDAAQIIELGTVQVNSSLSEFRSDRIFLNSTYWNATI